MIKWMCNDKCAIHIYIYILVSSNLLSNINTKFYNYTNEQSMQYIFACLYKYFKV